MRIILIGNRIEDFFYEKIDKRKPNRLSNLEYVGQDMIDAGNEFGPGIAYGTHFIDIKLNRKQKNILFALFLYSCIDF